MNKKKFLKLHDEIIDKSLEYTNALMEDGVKSVKMTLTNDFVVTFRDLKRKPRDGK